MVTAPDPNGTDLGLAQLFNFPASIHHSAPPSPGDEHDGPESIAPPSRSRHI